MRGCDAEAGARVSFSPFGWLSQSRCNGGFSRSSCLKAPAAADAAIFQRQRGLVEKEVYCFCDPDAAMFERQRGQF